MEPVEAISLPTLKSQNKKFWSPKSWSPVQNDDRWRFLNRYFQNVIAHAWRATDRILEFCIKMTPI